MRTRRLGITLLFLSIVLFAGVRASGCRRKPEAMPGNRTTTPGILGYTPVVFPATPTPAPGDPIPLPG